MTRFRSNPGSTNKGERLLSLKEKLRRQEYQVDTDQLIDALIRWAALRQVESSHQRSTISFNFFLQ